MNSLDDFDRRRDEFDRAFRRTQRWTFAGMVISGLVSLALLSFIAWVAIAVLNHLGITDVSLPGLALMGYADG